MPRRIIDLSVPLENGVAADPPRFGPKLTYLDHKQTVAEVCRYFPGLKPEDLPDGEGWAVERIGRAMSHVRMGMSAAEAGADAVFGVSWARVASVVSSNQGAISSLFIRSLLSRSHFYWDYEPYPPPPVLRTASLGAEDRGKGILPLN